MSSESWIISILIVAVVILAVEIRGNVEASSQIGRRGTRGQDLGTEDNGDVARFSVSDVVNLAI